MDKKINVKNLLFRAKNLDIDKTFKASLEKKVTSGMILEGGYVLYVSDRSFFLHSGMKTLQKMIGSLEEPERLTKFRNLPKDFLIKYFSDGYDEAKILKQWGPKCSQEAVTDILGANVCDYIKNLNSQMLTMDDTKLIDSGLAHLSQLPFIRESKRLYHQCKLEESSALPDLQETHTMSFTKGEMREEVFVPDVSKDPINIDIVSKKGNVDVKKKHYWIYSEEPGWGKSFNMREFSKKYNCTYVRDTKNATGMSDKVQFLLLDEYRPENKLNFSLFKSS